MAAPHATGVAALIVSAHGKRDGRNGGLDHQPRCGRADPDQDGQANALPVPADFAYPDDRDPSFDGVCEGTLDRNGIYGRGIVNALTAVLD